MHSDQCLARERANICCITYKNVGSRRPLGKAVPALRTLLSSLNLSALTFQQGLPLPLPPHAHLSGAYSRSREMIQVKGGVSSKALSRFEASSEQQRRPRSWSLLSIPSPGVTVKFVCQFGRVQVPQYLVKYNSRCFCEGGVFVCLFFR